jgi:tRNA A37 methylthiotransferase MiaB
VPGDVSAPRFGRLIDAQNAATRAYHDRKIGTTVRALIQGPSKKDPAKLAAKALDNVTVIAPMPPGYDETVYAREPWLDIAIETAHVWGCKGTILRSAARFDDVGTAVARPVIDLVAG